MLEVVLEAMAKIGFMFLVIMGFVPLLIWAERKGSAFIQDRTGPNRAGILGIRLAGLIHPLADVMKLLFKEDVVPAERHKVLYAVAPWLVMTVAMSTYAVIPFGDYLQIGDRQIPLVVADLEVGMLYVLAIASLGTYGVALGGWASNSKYTFLGSLRATASMISYEITMGLAIMGLFLIFGTFQLTQIAAGQGELIWGWLPKWGVVVQPVGFLLFIAAVYAETNRTPFDMSERDSEIVAGYHTEYSSLKFALFFMAEYVGMITASAFISTLFLGGWKGPGFVDAIIPGMSEWPFIWLFAKMLLLIFIFLWLQGSLMRFRYDQLMRFGWVWLFEFALGAALLTGAVIAFVL